MVAENRTAITWSLGEPGAILALATLVVGLNVAADGLSKLGCGPDPDGCAVNPGEPLSRSGILGLLRAAIGHRGGVGGVAAVEAGDAGSGGRVGQRKSTMRRPARPLRHGSRRTAGSVRVAGQDVFGLPRTHCGRCAGAP